jgi:hypothetical protein
MDFAAKQADLAFVLGLRTEFERRAGKRLGQAALYAKSWVRAIAQPPTSRALMATQIPDSIRWIVFILSASRPVALRRRPELHPIASSSVRLGYIYMKFITDLSNDRRRIASAPPDFGSLSPHFCLIGPENAVSPLQIPDSAGGDDPMTTGTRLSSRRAPGRIESTPISCGTDTGT